MACACVGLALLSPQLYNVFIHTGTAAAIQFWSHQLPDDRSTVTLRVATQLPFSLLCTRLCPIWVLSTLRTEHTSDSRARYVIT